MLALLWRLPDTSRWYAMRGRREEALPTLARVEPDLDPEVGLPEIEADLWAERGGRLHELGFIGSLFFTAGFNFGFGAMVWVDAMGGTGTFALFLGLAVVSFGFIAVMAPETRGHPLEAIWGYWENGGRWPD